MVNYTLKDIVKEYLIEIGDGNFSRYARMYQFAVSGLRELNMDTSNVLKIAELTVNDNDTVDLPNDFLSYSRIAICDSNGYLHSLGRNDNLCLNQNFDDCGNPIAHTSTDTDGYYDNGIGFGNLANNVRNSELMGRMFGIGGGNNINGSYRFDLPHGQILLSNLILNSSSIVLEYFGDIETIDGDFVVHPFFIETLKAWIYWKSIERMATKGLGEKSIAEQAYFRSKRKAQIRFFGRTDSDWAEAFRGQNKAAPKF